MFLEFKNKDKFYQQYINYFIERFTYSSISVEKPKEEDRIKQIKQYVEAFKYALELPYEKIGISDIIKIGNKVNETTGIEGLRRINVLSGSDFEPIEPYRIQYALMSLLNNYYYVWTDLDPFEKEAMFNIEFMRIHPFEDGNKRISKIILNSNLCRSDQAPVIITNEDTQEYYNFINSKDYLGFAEFLRQRSNVELNTMVGLYKMVHKIDVTATGDKILEKKTFKLF